MELKGAFMLIGAELETEREVLEALNKISEVQEAYPVYGAYNIIARIEADTMEDLKHAIALKIRPLDKIRSTMTIIIV